MEHPTSNIDKTKENLNFNCIMRIIRTLSLWSSITNQANSALHRGSWGIGGARRKKKQVIEALYLSPHLQCFPFASPCRRGKASETKTQATLPCIVVDG